VVPVFFEGHNSRLFQLASHLHYTLRMALLVNEFRIRVGEPVRVVIGAPLDAATLAGHACDARGMMDYLRAETYASYMGPLSDAAYQKQLESSALYQKYQEAINPVSAFEILSERLLKNEEIEEEIKKENASTKPSTRKRDEKSTFEEVLSSPVAKQVGRELVRGVFGMLFGTPTRSRSRKRNSSFF
jgi:hypothetical protein